MAGMLDRPVETFSFGVGSGWHDETEYAEIVASRFGTAHHALSGDCDDIDVLRQVIWHLDEPLADTAVIPTYQLSALTRQHVTVALTGEGADELLGGYDKYKALVVGDRLGRWLPGGALGAFHGLVANWPKASRGLNFLAAAKDRARAYMALIAVFDAADLRRVLTPEAHQLVTDQEPASEVIRRVLAGCNGPTWLDDLFQIDVHTWLVDDVLLKADKMSMAHGLEARVPFLDHPFAEFCASMPASLKVKGWREKHALREAMRDLVPERIVERRKHGFTVSLKPWAENADGALRHALSPAKLRERGWIDSAAVDRLLAADLDDIYVRRQVFTLLTLELWAETFLDPAVLPAPVVPVSQVAPAKAAASISG
jgi:asparagine synthase (glutamine-hydrolysing)